MTSSEFDPHLQLRSKLDEADKVVEQTLLCHDRKDPRYDTLKHEAFAELNAVLIAIKATLHALDQDLNLRPIERILEEFRNVYAGSINVLMMHENPDLKDVSGRPNTANKNEYLALIVAAVNISRGSDRSLDGHLRRVARKTGMTAKEVKNIRTRFMRGRGVKPMYSELARKLSNLPAGKDRDQYFETLVLKFNSLKHSG